MTDFVSVPSRGLGGANEIQESLRIERKRFPYPLEDWEANSKQPEFKLEVKKFPYPLEV